MFDFYHFLKSSAEPFVITLGIDRVVDASHLFQNAMHLTAVAKFVVIPEV